MTGTGITLRLALGKNRPSPAPQFIAESLQSVEINQSDQSPSKFQLLFHADRTKGLSTDYELLRSTLLTPKNRVILTITLNGTPSILIDGFITQQELIHSQEIGAAMLSVTGEDVSIVMDLYEYSTEYPNLGHIAIVELILAKYIPLLGLIIPEIFPATLPPYQSLQVDWVPQQNATDRAYLQQLAARHGYLFYMRPGPTFLSNIAYWGPPVRRGNPQPAMTVDMGPATNVESINFCYDALSPTLVYGFAQSDPLQPELSEDIPIVTTNSTRTPLSQSELQPLELSLPFIRTQQFTDPRLGPPDALAKAQAITDLSIDNVLVAQGQLNTLRYGHILQAPGIVGVRGVGHSYDGQYYVQSVTHKIARGNYQQQFTLTRSGLGSLTNFVQP